MHAMVLYGDHISPLSTGNITLNILHAQSALPFLVRKIAITNMMGMFIVIIITLPNSHSAVTGAKRQS